MTPFQVYLLMQADTICTVFGFLALIMGIITFIVTAIRTMENNSIIKKLHRWCMVIFIFTLLVGTFMPNTKTIATMVILPKITSPTALNSMGEKGQQLYDLATKALNQLVDKNQRKENKAP